MQKTGADKCERCGKIFEFHQLIRFRENEIKTFSDDVIKFLQKTHYDSLCEDCLTHYENLITEARKYPFPVEKDEVIEDVHYYREKGCWVFTELYSMQRGYCCKNGCRHCAYGFKTSKS